ncbi:MAG: S9 family peptidase, partial [Planctomycetota bacterium]
MNRALKQITVIAFLVICIIQVASAGRLEYPETQRTDHVDVYHGIEVIDTYRWLEEDVRESQRVRDWVNAQNKVTFKYLQSLPRREQIKERLTELWDYEKYSVPGKVGSRYYIAKNDGLQNHHVIYVMDSLDGQRRVLLNPNKWSKDGT